MLAALAGTARDLGRLQEIGAVLLRYGFGDFARRLGIKLPWKGAEAPPALEAPARVRHALQDLGPTFVKLGQILATRVDMFAPEWIAEFEKLQDQAPPAPYDEVRSQLIEDLGAPPEALFAAFDPAPIAAGSIAACSRTAARRPCSRWCSSTASSTPTRIPATCSTCPATASRSSTSAWPGTCRSAGATSWCGC